jgi:hypothetical protein
MTDNSISTLGGTAAYQAPEIRKKDAKGVINKEFNKMDTDTWSAAATLFEGCTGVTAIDK